VHNLFSRTTYNEIWSGALKLYNYHIFFITCVVVFCSVTYYPICGPRRNVKWKFGPLVWKVCAPL